MDESPSPEEKPLEPRKPKKARRLRLGFAFPEGFPVRRVIVTLNTESAPRR